MSVDINNLSNFELARWVALVYAVNSIASHAEARNVKFDNVRLKPIAINRYVNSISDNICHQIEELKSKKEILSYVGY